MTAESSGGHVGDRDERPDRTRGDTTTWADPRAGVVRMTVQPGVAQLPDQLLRDFFYASDALLCFVDGDRRILLANPALQRFTDRSAEEMLGEPFWVVYVVPEHAALSRDAVARAMATGIAHPQEGDWLTGAGE